MKWTTFHLCGRKLTHVQQDDNSNQCVAASLAMVCKNQGYSAHRFGEGSLFKYGTKAMRATNDDVPTSGMTDKDFITKHGVRHNAIALYLQGYGFKNVVTYSVATNGANGVANAINNMAAGSSAILACGVNQFHAFAAFKVGTTLFVLNPANPSSVGGFAYANKAAVEGLDDGEESARVQFLEPTAGDPTFRTVDSCYMIPSQWYLGTVKRAWFG